MADISYTPQFHHVRWVDNVDRVEAGGQNGFNTRFEAIENDLQEASTVVAQIDAALDELSTRPPTVTLSITPSFHQVGTSTPWALLPSGSAVAQSTGGPSGVLPLTLPDRIRLVSLRIRGRGTPPTGINTSFVLTQVAVADGATQNVTAFDTSQVPLNTTHTLPNQARNEIDLANFRYVFSANSGPATGDAVTLFSIQLTYSNT